MHQVFGVDVESGILADRTWRWFNVRMSAIINDPSTRLHAAIMADREQSAR